MRLEYIESFISVVNCKSFSRAAKQTFLSQPTISTHIKHLEAELGVQLLVHERCCAVGGGADFLSLCGPASGDREGGACAAWQKRK